jgi:hypothetical protein
MADEAASGASAGGWPSERHRLLLRAALIGRARRDATSRAATEPAVQAWEEWVAPVDWNDHLDAGSYAVLPLAYLNLTSLGVTHPVMDRLKGLCRRAWYEANETAHRVRGDVEALAAAGIEAMVAHALPLALGHCTGAGARPVSDVDLVVPPDRARAAVALLESRGWRRDDPARTDDWTYRAPVVLRDERGRPCRVHSSVVDGCGPAEAFWLGAGTFDLQGLAVKTPGHADSLLLAMALGGRGDAAAVLWVSDAAAIIRAAGDGLDWDRLVSQAVRRHLSLRAGTCLRYLADEMDVAVPAPVLARLAAARTSLVERLERRYPAGPEDPPSLRASLGLAYAAYRRAAGDPSPLRAVHEFPDYLRHRWRLWNRRQALEVIARRSWRACFPGAR